MRDEQLLEHVWSIARLHPEIERRMSTYFADPLKKGLVVFAFAELGSALIDTLPSLPVEVSGAIFAEIEKAMASSDERLGDAVATGLIERLVSMADKKPELWSLYRNNLGPKALEYALEWSTWGNEHPGV